MALVAGIEKGDLVRSLSRSTEIFRVVAIDPDEKKIAALHAHLIKDGLAGSKVDLICGDISGLPPYQMKLICSEKDLSAYQPSVIYDKLHPYGGRAVFGNAAAGDKLKKSELSGAETKQSNGLTLLIRKGALKGSAWWNHNSGGPGNTLSSEESRLRGALGISWYGGTSAGQFYNNRHDGAPRPQVTGGRVFCQKHDLLTCYDAYTGELLWQKNVPGMMGALKERAHPYTPQAYVLFGGNMVTMPDAVYVENGTKCLLLDPANGTPQTEFKLPGDATWGTIQILDELIGILISSLK